MKKYILLFFFIVLLTIAYEVMNMGIPKVQNSERQFTAETLQEYQDTIVTDAVVQTSGNGEDAAVTQQEGGKMPESKKPVAMTTAEIVRYLNSEKTRMESFCDDKFNSSIDIGQDESNPMFFKDACLYVVATSLMAPETCDKISSQGQDIHKKCHDDILEEQVKRGSMLRSCFDDKIDQQCIKKLADRNPDIWQLTSTDLPRENEMAREIIAKNITYCDNMSFYQDKSRCYGYFGTALNNPDYCELASYKNTEGSDAYFEGWDRATCYQNLALTYLNPEYCAKTASLDPTWEEVCKRDLSTIQTQATSCVKNGVPQSECVAMSRLQLKAKNDCRDSEDIFIVYGPEIEQQMIAFQVDACYKTIEKECTHLSTEAGRRMCQVNLESDLNKKITR